MKIFCIGLSRTGTTSISAALTELGYSVLHYPDTEDVVAKTLRGRFNWDVLDQYDAFTDAPIAAFYQELDVQVGPGSKFILTTRDIELWLTSCSKKIRNSEDRYSNLTLGLVYATVVRSVLYGRPYYSREHFKAAYRKHIQEVRAYFEFSNDLLVMNVNEGWEPLCRFLGKPIPNITFPNIRRSTGVYK